MDVSTRLKGRAKRRQGNEKDVPLKVTSMSGFQSLILGCPANSSSSSGSGSAFTWIPSGSYDLIAFSPSNISVPSFSSPSWYRTDTDLALELALVLARPCLGVLLLNLVDCVGLLRLDPWGSERTAGGGVGGRRETVLLYGDDVSIYPL